MVAILPEYLDLESLISTALLLKIAKMRQNFIYYGVASNYWGLLFWN